MTISVLLPSYNAMPYLPEAVDSIIAQTVTDWHLVIVDDGSTDESVPYFQHIRERLGSQVTIITFPENRGIVEALNSGLAFCTGDYIARMDADDISLPHRFERQLAHLQYHHNYDGCGSWIQFFGDENRLMEFPEQPEEVRDFLFLRTTVAHPTYFFKRRVYEQFRYDPNYEYAEDFDFLLRVTEYYRIGNVPEVLLRYRAHSQCRSCEDLAAQAESVKRARVEACKRRGLDPSFIGL